MIYSKTNPIHRSVIEVFTKFLLRETEQGFDAHFCRLLRVNKTTRSLDYLLWETIYLLTRRATGLKMLTAAGIHGV